MDNFIIFTYNLKLNYYRYFNPHKINHYNIINKLLRYKSIGLSFYLKYPDARNYVNLNDELFRKNPNAESEFKKNAFEQEKKNFIIKEIKNNMKIIK